MSAVLQREIGAADSADAWAGLWKFFWMPGPLRCAVVAGRDDLAVADDDTAHPSGEAGGTEGGREGQDHGVGGLVGPALLAGGMRLAGGGGGRGPTGASWRSPRGSGGHGSVFMLLACFPDPGKGRPPVRTS